MIRKTILLAAAALAIASAPLARGQAPSSVPPIFIGGPVTATPQPTVIVEQKPGTIIHFEGLGQALQPVVNDLVNTLILAGLGWLTWWLKTKFGVDLDEKRRATLETALSNAANSLIADGFVKLDGLQVQVDNRALAWAAQNVIEKRAPDAIKHFGMSKDYEAIKQRIVDAIPKTPAGAGLVVAAHQSAAAG